MVSYVKAPTDHHGWMGRSKMKWIQFDNVKNKFLSKKKDINKDVIVLPLLSLLTLLRNNSKVRDHKLITMLFFVLKVAIYLMPCYFDKGEEGLISFVHVFAIPTYFKKKITAHLCVISQLYIQLVNRPHFGTWILLLGPFW